MPTSTCLSVSSCYTSTRIQSFATPNINWAHASACALEEADTIATFSTPAGQHHIADCSSSARHTRTPQLHWQHISDRVWRGARHRVLCLLPLRPGTARPLTRSRTAGETLVPCDCPRPLSSCCSSRLRWPLHFTEPSVKCSTVHLLSVFQWGLRLLQQLLTAVVIWDAFVVWCVACTGAGLRCTPGQSLPDPCSVFRGRCFPCATQTGARATDAMLLQQLSSSRGPTRLVPQVRGRSAADCVAHMRMLATFAVTVLRAGGDPVMPTAVMHVRCWPCSRARVVSGGVAE